MKIKCGPSKETREKLQNEIDLLEFAKAKTDGIIFFAWWPVQINDDDCRWLENVKRKFIHEYHMWGVCGRSSWMHNTHSNSKYWKYEAL